MPCFPVGSKGRTASESEPKLFTPTLPVPKKISSGTKRDAPLPVGAGSSLASKKAKIVGAPFALSRSSDAERRGSPTAQVHHYDEIAKEGIIIIYCDNVIFIYCTIES